MQRELSAAEVSDLLSTNEDLQARVLQHMRIVDSGQWDQIRLNQVSALDWLFGMGTTGENLPMPTKGLVRQDPKYGVVVVYPDASGVLHFSADAPAILLVSDIVKPPFVSPTGNTLEQYIADFKTVFGSLMAGLIVAAVVYLVVEKSLE